MGMNFSPMYQPVSTKTIKADGDLNINPYDLLATDVKCDTVEATEFVGGVGNFSNILAPSSNITEINAGTINASAVNSVQIIPWQVTETVTNYPLLTGSTTQYTGRINAAGSTTTFAIVNYNIPTAMQRLNIGQALAELDGIYNLRVNIERVSGASLGYYTPYIMLNNIKYYNGDDIPVPYNQNVELVIACDATATYGGNTTISVVFPSLYKQTALD